MLHLRQIVQTFQYEYANAILIMQIHRNRNDIRMRCVLSPPDNRSRLHRRAWAWLLVVLIIYAISHRVIGKALTIGEYNTGRHLMIAVVCCAVLYMLMVRRWYSTVQAEVIVFGIWLLWCLLGAREALLTNPLLPKGFWLAYRWAVVTGLVFLVSAGITAMQKSVTAAFLAFTLGALIVICIAVYTGEYQETSIDMTHRLGAVTEGNANAFSYLLFFGVVGAAYFISNTGQHAIQTLNIIMLVIFTIGIILSASRKALLGECLFILLWLWFCYHEQLFQKRRAIVIAIVLMGSLYISGTYVMNNTLMGERFREDTMLEHEEDRIDKYRESILMIREEPIFGIGLGNFADQSRSGRASHSDYVGVFTQTGVVGGLLYFGVYVILWRRLSRVQAQVRNPNTLRTIGILKAAIISILCIALGRWNWNHPVTYALLGAAAGFSWSLDKTFSISRRLRIWLTNICLI